MVAPPPPAAAVAIRAAVISAVTSRTASGNDASVTGDFAAAVAAPAAVLSVTCSEGVSRLALRFILAGEISLALAISCC